MAAAGHKFFAPSYTGLGERAHLARPENGLDTHIQDVAGVLKFEELRNVGHSYGGMVATGVADRARDRVVQLIYLDAFVPDDGQALIDFLPQRQRQRQRLLDSVNAGDGWRVAPNPIPADTSEQDSAWIAKLRMPQSVRCFQQPIHLQAKVTLPRSYIQCTRYADQGPFGQFAARARRDGWPLYELDASHSPNVTAPDALVELLQ
jgi:pimeloyl-ACP methyl ester carboxylesterase